MSATELRRLVESEVCRWECFARPEHRELRDDYAERLGKTLSILMDSQWPWPRVKSCIGTVLARISGDQSYPPTDRVLHLVREALKPRDRPTVVCRHCEETGGIGIWADSKPAMNDAVYGLDPTVDDGAPAPLCCQHYDVYAYRKALERFHAGKLGMEPVAPSSLRRKANPQEVIG